MDETIHILEQIIGLHESMKGYYFYIPPSQSWSRRYYEEKHSKISTFEYKGDTYLVEQNTRCSCKNVYYSVKYYKNDEQISVDIRFIKKILKELNSLAA